MKTKEINIHIRLWFLLCCSSFYTACNPYLQIDPPIDSVSASLVFADDDAAKSALTGIYSNMVSSGSFADGGISSITATGGMSSDEFIAYSNVYEAFYKNALSSATSFTSVWNRPYFNIYTANKILEGLSENEKISAAVKTQLQGEAKFIRAFCYFYLTNLFGDVPMHLTTDYRMNSKAGRTKQSEVYQQIIKDLLDAQALLGNNYYTTERVRPNKWAATALLARVYLYTKDYQDAEIQATTVINNTAMFSLKDDLNQVFLKNSTEAIWQLMPNTAGRNTTEAVTFIFLNTPTGVSLTQNLIEAFEPGDKRRTSWVGSTTVSGKTYYYPYKYKVGAVSSLSEYSMVLRLAEQYLIRAEARINLDKTEAGIQDINLLRTRSRALATPTVPNPLPPLPVDLSKPEALLAVEKERRIEFFSEWGHRWFDIKRTGRADAILAPLKGTGWQSTDVLWPIPQADINNNASLTQNKGY
ncbi:RagB/SusD family nutrient uptake outer membrane protein [Pedobacter heparinus]|uniref:RagB/SusD family nutrient uptake outer membrane protein n=1 Tax=Pedobacter heparinus TaxID=984 RepID=UPI00292F1D65|nr:RagB/SusD family nutrient uptake outer membrane protein [Pedobacter heparinus]